MDTLKDYELNFLFTEWFGKWRLPTLLPYAYSF